MRSNLGAVPNVAQTGRVRRRVCFPHITVFRPSDSDSAGSTLQYIVTLQHEQPSDPVIVTIEVTS